MSENPFRPPDPEGAEMKRRGVSGRHGPWPDMTPVRFGANMGCGMMIFFYFAATVFNAFLTLSYPSLGWTAPYMDIVAFVLGVGAGILAGRARKAGRW
jgi:hypothetical protein